MVATRISVALGILLLLPPAMRAQTTPTLPGEFLYPRTSRALWDEVKRLAEDIGLRADRLDERHQLLVTRWTPYTEAKFVDVPALGLASGLHPRAVQFHVYVPADFDPARLAVGAILDVQTVESARAWIYHQQTLAGWFVTRLNQRLRATPEPLADSWTERAAQSQRMKPDGFRPDCSPAPALANKSTPPRRLSNFSPLYPGDDPRRAPVKVVVNGVITEHGTFANPQPAMAEPGSERFVSAAKAAVGLWRFEPARMGGCPMTVFYSAAVSFQTR